MLLSARLGLALALCALSGCVGRGHDAPALYSAMHRPGVELDADNPSSTGYFGATKHRLPGVVQTSVEQTGTPSDQADARRAATLVSHDAFEGLPSAATEIEFQDTSLPHSEHTADEPWPPGCIRLRPWECRCMAAERSAVGNMLKAERRLAEAAARQAGRSRRARVLQLVVCLLQHREAEQRNQSAAAGLTAYYRLAEANDARTSIRLALQEIDAALLNYDELKRQNLELNFDVQTLRRQKLQLLSQQAKVDVQVRRLNQTLALLLTGCGGQEQRYCPDRPQLDPESIDVEQAVRVGLANRSDLAAIRLLCNRLDESTLPVVRDALQQVDPSLGGSYGPEGKLARLLQRPFTKQQEIPVRSRQVCQLLQTQREQIENDIRQAARTASLRRQDAVVAQRSLDSWRQSLDRLLDQRRAGAAEVTVFEIHAGEVEIIQAQRELAHRIAEWKVARVNLRQSQGLLANGCQ